MGTTLSQTYETPPTRHCKNSHGPKAQSNTPQYTITPNTRIPDIMPRGGEYDDGPTVASDNPIESGENKIAGAPKGDSDVSSFRSSLSLTASL